MLRLLNTALPMHLDRLYASEGSSQAPYASAKQDITVHQTWQDELLNAEYETAIIERLNPNSGYQHQQHGIDT